MEQEPVEIPGISIQTSEGEMILHWFNSRIRTFKDPQYDHIEYRKDEEANLKAFKVSEDLMNMMLEMDYPYTFEPVTDDATYEWFINLNMRMLEEALEE